jgi:hypothetical protein
MANSIRFDLNRMRKTYPLIRRKPRFKELGSISGVELAHLVYNDSSTATYTFTNSYRLLPVCVVTPEQDNVNVYISSLSLTSITVESSYNFTGKVHIHIYADAGD